MRIYLLIFLASGFGGILRYWFGGLIQSWWGPTFPAGTLVVNVSGCLGIGFFATLFSGPSLIREEYRVAILVGIFGGYTTFSSFGREMTLLAREGEWSRAAAYLLLTNVVGILAVGFGNVLATTFCRTEGA